MKLRIVHQEGAIHNPGTVAVTSNLTHNKCIRFEFVVATSEFTTQPNLPMDQPAWGLWETDVVEVFIKSESCDVYYEFQVSPLGQFFEMKILKPRKEFDTTYRSGMKFGVAAGKSDGCWTAWLEIPMMQPDWNTAPQNWTGGAFACLGPKGQRSYFAAFLPDQAIPDFHLPEYFKPIANLK